MKKDIKMKKLFFRIINRIVLWYKNECRDREIAKQASLIKVLIVDRKMSRAEKDEAIRLRAAGTLYHQASQMFLEQYPDKTPSDFDTLTLEEKNPFLDRVDL